MLQKKQALDAQDLLLYNNIHQTINQVLQIIMKQRPEIPTQVQYAVLPIPLQTFTDKLERFADEDESALRLIQQHRQHVLPKQHPVRSLLLLRGRTFRVLPDATAQERTDDRRHRLAYRAGVVLAASLLIKREAQVYGDAMRSLELSDDQVVVGAIKQVADRGERFPVGQFVDANEDVRPYFSSILESSWISSHVSFLHGHEHDVGHNDYVLIGAGDTLAEFAIRDQGWQTEDIRTDKLA